MDRTKEMSYDVSATSKSLKDVSFFIILENCAVHLDHCKKCPQNDIFMLCYRSHLGDADNCLKLLSFKMRKFPAAACQVRFSMCRTISAVSRILYELRDILVSMA